jgi:serine/threonine protein kinase
MNLSLVFGMISKIVDQLEIVHTAGRTYNDLKLSNIMVQADESGNFYPVLIDFGFAAKYIDESGSHFDEGLKEDG